MSTTTILPDAFFSITNPHNPHAVARSIARKATYQAWLSGKPQLEDDIDTTALNPRNRSSNLRKHRHHRRHPLLNPAPSNQTTKTNQKLAQKPKPQKWSRRVKRRSDASGEMHSVPK